MILLVPISTYTAGIESGEAAAIVPLNLTTINDIIEDKEDGFAVIHHADGKERKINVPFTDLVNSIARTQGGLSILNIPKLEELSPSIKLYLTTVPIQAI